MRLFLWFSYTVHFSKRLLFSNKALSGYFRRTTRMLLLQLRRRHWIQSLHSRWSHRNRKSQQKMERIFQWGNYCWRLWHFWHQFPKGFGRDKKGPFVRCYLPHWLQLFWKKYKRETTKAEQNYWTQINPFGYCHRYARYLLQHYHHGIFSTVEVADVVEW